MKIDPKLFETLSRSEKLLLNDLLDEQIRRRREKLDEYEANPGQAAIHKSNKQIRAAFCGNGFGKTALGANEALWALKGFNPWLQKFTPTPSRGVIVLDSPSKVTDVWLPELRKWGIIKPEQCAKRGKPYVTQINWPNGSEVLFMFHEQDPLLFESIEADWLIFDEPPPRKVYVGLMRGLRKLGSEPWMLFLGTPITAGWMRRELYEPWAKGQADHIECFRFSSDVNKDNINWDFYNKTYFKGLSEKEINIRRHGLFFDREGLALGHLFDREKHLVDPLSWPSGHNTVIAIDPHPAKNHVAIMLGTDKHNQLYYIKELSSSAPPAQFAVQLKGFMKGFRVVDIVCDSLGATPGSGGDGNKTFIDVLRDNGIRARSTTYKEKYLN